MRVFIARREPIAAFSGAPETSARSNRRRALRRFLRSPYNIIGGAFILAFLIAAVFADLIAPIPPNKISLPNTFQGPNANFWLGTDHLGRDILSRIVHGARVSTSVSFGAVGLALLLGVPLGMIAGYTRSRLRDVIMRVMDALWSFPAIILALTIAAVLGPNLRNMILAIGITFTPAFARVMFAQVLSLREEVYVDAARASGASGAYILAAHIFPNTVAPLTVYGSIMAAEAIIAEAGLSFLGAGVTPPQAAWGSMLRLGFPYVQQAPWIAIFPGLAIFLMVLAFNLLGDGIRDAMDVRLADDSHR